MTQARLDLLLKTLADGKTVYLQTHLRTTVIRQRDVDRFAAAGRPLFRADERSLYISTGKRYDCIDYCRVTVQP